MAQSEQPIDSFAQQVIDLAKLVRREINHPADETSGRLQPEDFEVVFTKAVEAMLDH